jgi:aspartate ammonia-lyase
MVGFPDPPNDVCVVLALAALQMELNKLQPEIKQLTLSMITNRKDITTWVEPESRLRELDVFKQKLLRY